MGIISIGYSVLILLSVGVVSADMAKDREECASQLVGLATCLPYVGGTAKAPTLDCCTGLKQVLGGKSKKCLCILVKDRNDPQLGLKINATLALGLPATCHIPSNVSECPTLLNLAPNSPDARVFEQFANSSKGTASAPPSNAKGTSSSSSNANEKSDSSSLKRLSGIEMVVGTLICSLTLFFFKGFY